MDGRRRSWVAAGAAGLLAFLVLHFWVPPEGARFVICPFRRLTGLPCPGCGLTRAFAHLAKGEWSAAVLDHPLAPLLAVEIFVGWLTWGLLATGRLRQRLGASMDRIVLWHAAALLVVWVGRLVTGTLPL
jgi:Protein of unknown function (DUF2752)